MPVLLLSRLAPFMVGGAIGATTGVFVGLKLKDVIALSVIVAGGVYVYRSAK